MYLRVAGVGEKSTPPMRPPSCGDIAHLGIGGEKIDIAVAARCQHHGVRAVRRHFPCEQVAHHDAHRSAVMDDDIQHLFAVVQLHRAGGDLAHKGRIRAQQKLLPCLAASVESARDLRPAERAIVQQPGIVTGERHALCHALVDDLQRHLGETVHIGFA